MTTKEEMIVKNTLRQFNNMDTAWHSNTGEDSLYKKVLIDEWLVEKKYPFEITQQSETVLSDNVLDDIEQMNKSMPGAASMIRQTLKSTLNSTYGMMQMPTFWREAEIYEEKKHKFLENAECRQKELLVEHYNHKILKLSPKKKEEIETLKNIVKKPDLEVIEYIDAYPERYL